MEHKLVLCQTIKNNFDEAKPEVWSTWNMKGYSSTDDFLLKIKDRLNLYNSKLNISEIEFRSTVEVYESTCNFLGLIESVEDKPQIKAYVFFTKPFYGSRSGFFEQQFIPVISSVIINVFSSNEYHLTNRPVYIVNINAEKMTPSMALSIYSGKVVGFHIIDMMDNDVNTILLKGGYDTTRKSITEFDKIIAKISSKKVNEFFEVNSDLKKIKYKNDKFKDKSGKLKTTLTNEPYWFILKSLAALYLVDKDGYSFDVSDLDNIGSNKNKILEAFKKYVKKIGG